MRTARPQVRPWGATQAGQTGGWHLLHMGVCCHCAAYAGQLAGRRRGGMARLQPPAAGGSASDMRRQGCCAQHSCRCVSVVEHSKLESFQEFKHEGMRRKCAAATWKVGGTAAWHGRRHPCRCSAHVACWRGSCARHCCGRMPVPCGGSRAGWRGGMARSGRAWPGQGMARAGQCAGCAVLRHTLSVPCMCRRRCSTLLARSFCLTCGSMHSDHMAHADGVRSHCAHVCPCAVCVRQLASGRASQWHGTDACSAGKCDGYVPLRCRRGWSPRPLLRQK
jgi:hypothetical protein